MIEERADETSQPQGSNKMLAPRSELEAPRAPGNNQALINEAIKRILLDIVIRGHGERLIGRWSREPSIQAFLERVPYLLDRINQLHLICMRASGGGGAGPSSELQHVHSHHHSHHRHQHRSHAHHSHHKRRGSASRGDSGDEKDVRENDDEREQEEEEDDDDEGRSCLHDFVNLIGSEHHWLVRTRDSLGLTPLHKAVLFNNRPIVEFILDRYPDELAPGPARAAGARSPAGGGQQRLIDAQDKYGRSALHYAAAALAAARHRRNQAAAGQHEHEVAAVEQQLERLSAFKFLLAKGADRRLRDFRGKTPDYYVRHADQLRARSIIHLANKLNANYQAAVLSRTLKALDEGRQLATWSAASQLDEEAGGGAPASQQFRSRNISGHSAERRAADETAGRHRVAFDTIASGAPSENRASMSVSCADLRAQQQPLSECQNEDSTAAAPPPARSRSTMDLTEAAGRFEAGAEDDEQLERLLRTSASSAGGSPTPPPSLERDRASQDLDWPLAPSSMCSSASGADSSARHTPNFSVPSEELKRLLAERVERPVLDERTRARVKKCLAEARLEAINQLVVDGLGALVVEQARLYCWNLACKRYIATVVPKLLSQLDALHEFVATNQFSTLRALLTSEPILARCKRPYRRARLNALHLAVQLNRKSIVAHLLSRFPELARELDSQGATCLHWAARSLHSDRLYNWLRDHFGAQLEALRDARGKTAADYRQQAIRLASFEQPQQQQQQLEGGQASGGGWRRKSSSSSGAAMDVERILKDTRAQENELQASGVRSQLIRRPAAGVRSRAAAETPRHRAAPRAATSKRAVPDGAAPSRADEAAQVGLSLESKSESEGQTMAAAAAAAEAPISGDGERNTSRVIAPDESLAIQSAPAAAAESQLLEEFGQLDAADLVGETFGQAATPAANGASRPRAPAPKIDFAPRRANDDNSPRFEPITSAGANQRAEREGASAPAVKAGNGNGNGIVLAKIGARPVTPGGQAARERNLSQIIGDCIAGEQFKKLEHLILAGCGQRVQQIHAALKAAPGARVSPEMEAYLGGRAVEFMETCAQIHKQVHRCQSHVLFPTQLDDGDDDDASDAQACEDEDEARAALEHKLDLAAVRETSGALAALARGEPQTSRESLNACFHKLSSLLQDNCFIMARDQFGASPLHVALLRSDDRLLDYLLRRHPSAASAPDHDNRTALHYAAIVLAARQRHGPFKLTDGWARAYWQLGTPAGQPARQVYENLRLRFGHDLISLRDRKGKRAQDYLVPESEANNESKHLILNKLPRGLYKPQLLGDCCAEYAEMLARYNYLVLVARDLAEEQKRELARREREEPRSSASEPITRIQSPATAKVRPQHSCSLESRRQTRFVEAKSALDYCDSTSSEPLALNSTTTATTTTTAAAATTTTAISRSDEVGQDEKLVAGKLASGGGGGGARPEVDPAATVSKPCAPVKPLERPPSRTKVGRKQQQEQQEQEQTSLKRLIHSAPRTARKHNPSDTAGLSFTAPTEMVPVPVGHSPLVGGSRPGSAAMSSYSAPALADGPQLARLSKHRHKRHHGKRTHSGRRPTNRLSVVGGVIVPTIIHNDKMDEIETYDIIYRQPPSATTGGSSSSSSSASSTSSASASSASSRTSNSSFRAHSSASSASSSASSRSNSAASLSASLLSLDANLDEQQHHRRHHHHGHHHHQRHHRHGRDTATKRLLPGKSSRLIRSPAGSTAGRSPVSPTTAAKGAQLGRLNGELAGGDERAMEEEDEEDEDEQEAEEDQEEDDRVERLSNEFEDRVRREKSELRQKVDQIMKEIKLSAKSGKSSRFLASPNDLSALNSGGGGGGGQGAAAGQQQQTRLLLTGEPQAMAKSIGGGGGSSSKHSTGTDNSTFSSTRSTCSSSQCNSSHGSSSSLAAGVVHARTSSCSSSSSAASTMSSVSSPTTSLGAGSKSRHKTVTISEPRAPQPVGVGGVGGMGGLHHRHHHQVTIQAPIASTAGGGGAQNKHLSELTGQMVSKNTYGQTYLHFIASKSQSSSTLYKVLDHGNHLIGERDIFYRTARDVALQFSLQNNVQVLDKYIIDLFIGGQTQLLWLLLNQGYSPLIHVSDPDGNDIMLILKLLKQERMIGYLLQMADFQRWRDELHTFIRHGYSAGVSELIRKHKDLVRAKSAYSRTSLHLAVLFDRVDMLAELIAVDPNCVQAVDNMGRTPLHYVYGLHLKNGELIRDQLLERGASLDTRDVRERTPKYYYIFRREIEDIRRIELELN